MAGGDELTECVGASTLKSLVEEETLEGSYHPSFQCCVCLDLLFKPVVLACGHMSCFWCVHKAMHGLRASYCAMCRQPYIHFPSICEALHLLVLKMEPIAYKRREKEVLEEERRIDVFSPQFNSSTFQNICSDCNCSGDLKNVGDSLVNQENSRSNISKEDDLLKKCSKNDILMDISKDDLLCVLCQELLFQPAVLNCGHGVSQESQCKKSSKVPTEGHLWFDEDLSKVNVGVGCDSCGMYPIIGKRYRCKDCKEAVGFDLCESCYNTSSKLSGRFNQQHTPDHLFVLDESHMLYNILLLSSPSMEDSYQVFSEDISSADEPDQNGSVSIISDNNVDSSNHCDDGNN